MRTKNEFVIVFMKLIKSLFSNSKVVYVGLSSE